MNPVLLTMAIVMANLLAGNVFAQSKGEADPAQSMAAPSATATPAEKVAARTKRRPEAVAQARASVANGSKPVASEDRGVVTAKASPEEKAAARNKRRAETIPAVRAGETSVGEMGKKI